MRDVVSGFKEDLVEIRRRSVRLARRFSFLRFHFPLLFPFALSGLAFYRTRANSRFFIDDLIPHATSYDPMLVP
jgi:hypothetical protein